MYESMYSCMCVGTRVLCIHCIVHVHNLLSSKPTVFFVIADTTLIDITIPLTASLTFKMKYHWVLCRQLRHRD